MEEDIVRIASVMTVEVFAFSILDNHFHLVLKIRPDLAKRLSARKVAIRFLTLCPSIREPLPEGVLRSDPPTAEEIREFMAAPTAVAEARTQLSSVSLFMRLLKHPISCKANAEDGTKGGFWEGRFHCYRVLDPIALLAVLIYVDLNPLRAGIVRRVENSTHTSVYYRIEKFLNRCPPKYALCAAILADLPGVRIGDYLKHIDASARRLTPGKYSVPEHEASIEHRLGLSSEQWNAFLTADVTQLRGTAIGTEESMRVETKRRGLKRMWNTFTHLADA